MKSAIIYYSFTGRTKKTSEILAEFLRDKGEVDLIQLIPLDESKSFLGQGKRAFMHTRALIELTKRDLTEYDLICFGTPVWAFGPAPAMNTYLDTCRGIQGKDVILFTTYGSGTGNNRCLDYMHKLLWQKGARGFKRFSIQQFKVKDKAFVLEKIKQVVDK
jgi:flavodoxin